MAKHSLPPRLERFDVDPSILMEALNNEQKAEQLMKEKGWSKSDLLDRADLLAKELSASISAVNQV